MVKVCKESLRQKVNGLLISKILKGGISSLGGALIGVGPFSPDLCTWLSKFFAVCLSKNGSFLSGDLYCTSTVLLSQPGRSNAQLRGHDGGNLGPIWEDEYQYRW